MTASNGDHGRIVEHVDGQVASANERGLKLVGEDGYRNFSKYATPPIAPPRRGASVRLSLDTDGYVRELQVLAGDVGPSGSTADSTRDRTITRLSVLKTAANFLGQMAQVHEEVRSDHVLALADKWLAWIEQPD